MIMKKYRIEVRTIGGSTAIFTKMAVNKIAAANAVEAELDEKKISFSIASITEVKEK